MKITAPIKALAIALPIFYLTSCNEPAENVQRASTTDTTVASKVQFKNQSIEQASANCSSDSTTCAVVNIHYPEAVAGPAPMQQNINKFVQQRIRQVMLDFNPDADTSAQGDAARQLADAFLKQQRQYVEEISSGSGVPTATARWELSIDAKPLYVSDGVVSMEIFIYHYAGGAHPNYYRVLQSFGAAGEHLSLKEIVTDTVKLRKLTEEKFRQVKEGVGNKPLAEAGLFIDGDTLPFPQNAALTPEGLLLYYNPYEIGPWAFGDSEIILPYQQVNILLAAPYRH